MLGFLALLTSALWGAATNGFTSGLCSAATNGFAPSPTRPLNIARCPPFALGAYHERGAQACSPVRARAPVATCKSAATHPFSGKIYEERPSQYASLRPHTPQCHCGALWMVQHRSGIAASAAASAGQSDAESEDSGAAGVVYLECAGDQRLSGFLRKHVGTDASDLIHLGAVWVRKCKENKRGRKMLPWARRIEDGQIRKGSRVRVFTCPTRFPDAGRTNWAERVLYEDDEFLVMNREPYVAKPKPQTPSSVPCCT